MGIREDVIVTKTAIQIYSLRDTVLEQTEAVLQSLKKAGYDGVELVNFGDDWLENAVRLMQQIGLEVFSIHTDIEEIKTFRDEKLKKYADWGVKYIPIGHLPEERRPGFPLYEETKKLIAGFSERCRKYGMTLLYHNHEFDFVKLGDRYAFDILLSDLTAELLGAELDTCWIYTAGADVIEYQKKYADVCPVLHIKDCVKEGGRKGFRAIGEGVLDFREIIRVAKEEKTEWLCVEQDLPSPGKTALQCAEYSIHTVKELL